MTDDELYIIKLNIAHYQAMLKLDIDDEKRSMVEQLRAEAEELLATDLKRCAVPEGITNDGKTEKGIPCQSPGGTADAGPPTFLV